MDLVCPSRWRALHARLQRAKLSLVSAATPQKAGRTIAADMTKEVTLRPINDHVDDVEGILDLSEQRVQDVQDKGTIRFGGRRAEVQNLRHLRPWRWFRPWRLARRSGGTLGAAGDDGGRGFAAMADAGLAAAQPTRARSSTASPMRAKTNKHAALIEAKDDPLLSHASVTPIGSARIPNSKAANLPLGKAIFVGKKAAALRRFLGFEQRPLDPPAAFARRDASSGVNVRASSSTLKTIARSELNSRLTISRTPWSRRRSIVQI
jgi:hypothetical protein